jgi:hypothetical protein
MTEDLCQCPKCGRMHRVLSTSVPSYISGKLSHLDACRLSRVFGLSSDLRTAQDYRINEWLKLVIEESQRVAP